MTADAPPDFEAFVAARGRAFLRLAYVLTRDSHLAEDLVQEALAQAHLRWRRIEHHEAYVRKGVLNGFLSWRRRRSSSEVAVADTATVAVATSADPADEVVDRLGLAGLIAGLPRKQRAVLVLRYVEDLADEEIGRLLGCTPSTVRSHAQKALSSLRRECAVADPEGAPA